MKKRPRKILVTAAACLAAALIVSMLMLPKFLDLNRYKGFIVSKIQEATGGEVTLGKLSWKFSNGIWLNADEFSFVDNKRFLARIELSRLTANISIIPLLWKNVVLKHLVLDKPEVKLKIQPDLKTEFAPPSLQVSGEKAPKTNTGDLPKEAPTISEDSASERPVLPVKIEIQKLAIENGRLQLENAASGSDELRLHLFSIASLKASNVVPGQKMAFEIDMRDENRSGAGALEVRGTFSGLTEGLTLKNPKLTAKGSLSSFHPDVIKPYFKTISWIQHLEGNLSLEADYTGQPAAGKHHIQGDIDLSDISYTDDALWETSLTGAETKISCEASLDPEKIFFQRFHLNKGELKLNLKGTLKRWREIPSMHQVELSAEFPVIELMPLLPWKLWGSKADFWRFILEHGGSLVIDHGVISEIDFERLPTTFKGWTDQIDLTGDVSEISLQPFGNFPKIEKLGGQVKIKRGMLDATNVSAVAGPLSLPLLQLHFEDIAAEQLIASFKAKGPLKLAATSKGDIETLLRGYGLKSLSGTAQIDMNGDFDQRRSNAWWFKGNLDLDGVRAETFPEAAIMKNLKGLVTVERNDSLNIAVQDLSADIDKKPVKLSGKIYEIGKKDLLIDVKAHAQKLDMAHLSKLFPQLHDKPLTGMIDVDLDIYIPFAALEKARLNGMLFTENAEIQLGRYTLKKGDIDIGFSDTSAKINRFSMTINDQYISANGHLNSFTEPDILLTITSPDLNMDRLMPEQISEKLQDLDPLGAPLPYKEKDQSAELPPILRQTTAKLQIDVKQGRFNTMAFQNMKLDTTYEHGVIKLFNLYSDVDDGRVDLKGTANLQQAPDRIEFTVNPDIDSLKIGTILQAADYQNPPLTGPMSLSGQLRGYTDNSKNILAGLTGLLKIEAGPGKLTESLTLGKVLLKILSITSIKGILSGNPVRDLTGEGLSYQKITSHHEFDDGNSKLSHFLFESQAMNLDAEGAINYNDNTMNIEATLVPLGMIDKVVGSIPVLGSVFRKFTTADIALTGPLDDPQISISFVKSAKRGTEKSASEKP
jgi:hypothetical protein